MSHSHLSCLFNVALVSMLVIVTSSCMSVSARRNPHINSPAQPKVYPGLETMFNFSGATKNNGGFEFVFPWYVQIVGGTIGLVLFTVDFPLEIVLDTVLLPTDLIFAPGAIIGKETSQNPSSLNQQHDSQKHLDNDLP